MNEELRWKRLLSGSNSEMRKSYLGMLAGVTPLLAVLCACAGPQFASAEVNFPGKLALHGNKTTLEISPVLLAARDYYPGEVSIKMGGVYNLVGEVAGSGESGLADVATNSETQLLRLSLRYPGIRAVLNVSEGLYRIVARRSAGIESVADLRGKRIATIAQTSSGYFLQRMLEREGLGYDDIMAVPIMPLSKMAEALQRREVDAVVIWEPWSQHAARVLGDDIAEFDGKGVYRELFNFNTTADNLADPEKRAKIVRMTRAIMDAAAEIRTDPGEAQKLLAKTAGLTLRDVEESWRHHAFPAAIPADMLDVMVEEEKWLAKQDGRTPRSRTELAPLIDTSVYEEAKALGAQSSRR